MTSTYRGPDSGSGMPGIAGIGSGSFCGTLPADGEAGNAVVDRVDSTPGMLDRPDTRIVRAAAVDGMRHAGPLPRFPVSSGECPGAISCQGEHTAPVLRDWTPPSDHATETKAQ